MRDDLKDTEPLFISEATLNASYTSRVAKADQSKQYKISLLLLGLVFIVGIIVGVIKNDETGNYFIMFFSFLLLILIAIFFGAHRQQGIKMYLKFKQDFGKNAQVVSTLSDKFVKMKFLSRDVELFFPVETITSYERKAKVIIVYSSSALAVHFDEEGFKKGSPDELEKVIQGYIEANVEREEAIQDA